MKDKIPNHSRIDTFQLLVHLIRLALYATAQEAKLSVSTLQNDVPLVLMKFQFAERLPTLTNRRIDIICLSEFECMTQIAKCAVATKYSNLLNSQINS